MIVFCIQAAIFEEPVDTEYRRSPGASVPRTRIPSIAAGRAEAGIRKAG